MKKQSVVALKHKNFIARILILIFVYGTTGSFISASEPDAAQDKNLFQEMTSGKFSLNTRYRYEIYEQNSAPGNPITADAKASTLRLSVNYMTNPYFGFSAFGEYTSVCSLGETSYRIPTVPSQNNTTLPVILDALSSEFSQHYLQFSNSFMNTTLKAGRQELKLGNGRFVDNIPWRQNHQTFDAVSMQGSLDGHVSFLYAYAGKVYRVIDHEATDGELAMHTNMANITYKAKNYFSAAVYGILLDEYACPANSTKNLGIRVEGPYKIDNAFNLLYAIEFAKQNDYATNPNKIDENYFLSEIGLGYNQFKLKVQYNLRGAKSSTDEFNTPLSCAWDGWVEKFILTPNLGTNYGLKVFSVSLSGAVTKLNNPTFTVIGYDYRSDTGQAHYGRELDAGAEYRIMPIDKNLILGWRFGNYFADQLLTDSIRTSIYMSYLY